MEKVKEIIANYSLWGFFLGLAEYMDIPTPVKYGISGVCGLFAVRIYMIADSVLKTAQNDPFNFIKNIKGRK